MHGRNHIINVYVNTIICTFPYITFRLENNKFYLTRVKRQRVAVIPNDYVGIYTTLMIGYHITVWENPCYIVK